MKKPPSSSPRSSGKPSSSPRSSGKPSSVVPTLRVERSLLREGHLLLAALDEVGRGALAGPASVGVVLVDAGVRTAPSGVRDSKLLTPAAREALVPRIRRWALAYAVGHAGPDEVDQVGILGALRLAAHRAIDQLPQRPDLVLLDGNHDYLTDPMAQGLFQQGLFEQGLLEQGLFEQGLFEQGLLEQGLFERPSLPVRTRIKADMTCSSVAAASVLAKVERDAMMVALHEQHPEYGWATNKGYSAPDHMAALVEHGTTVHHRRSWRLPPYERDDDDGQGVRQDGAVTSQPMEVTR